MASAIETRHGSRLGPLDPATADAIALLPGLGLLALEADGSRLLPFKAPGEGEPALAPCVTHVVAVVGIDALDAPLDAAHVHRPERVRAIVDRATCDAALIAEVLASPRGGRKDVGTRSFTVIVNKADLDPEGALRLGHAIRDAGVARVLITRLTHEEAPLVAILGG